MPDEDKDVRAPYSFGSWNLMTSRENHLYDVFVFCKLHPLHSSVIAYDTQSIGSWVPSKNDFG